MRAWVLLLGLTAGCQLSLHAPGGQVVDTGGPTGVGDNGGTTPSSGSGQDPQPPMTPDPVPTPDMAQPPVSLPPPDMATVPIGAACGSDADCGGSPRVCGKDFRLGATTIKVPGGYCTMSCSPSVKCPDGSACVAFSFGSWCESLCPNPDPCGRKGYSCCQPSGADQNVCLPGQLCPAPAPGG